MNRDDIIRMAREAGFAQGVAELLGLKKFARFAALVAAAEREACAKVCDELAHSPALAALEKYRASFIADAIRCRSEIDSIVQNELPARVIND